MQSLLSRAILSRANQLINSPNWFLLGASLLWAFIISPSAKSQELAFKRPIQVNELPRIEAEITADGYLDEAVWQQALQISLDYETDPGENTTPPVKTQVYLFENGEYIFVGFNALDDNPAEIRDYLTDRDKIWESDFVGIKFDTFGESRKAFQFFVNALGVQADSAQEDFRGDDVNWNTLWESYGRITETGYIVEMAIPFKSLRFPKSDSLQEWGLEIVRFYPRAFKHRIANAPVNRNIACRVCQFDKLRGFKDAIPPRNFELSPTLVVGQSESRADAFSPWQKSDVDSELGLNARWGITPDVILNATINPDFSQVEADSAQLNVNSTDTLFLPEKRPFFLEGRDYFSTLRNLAYTRNIAAPEFGIKVSGQSDSHSFGAFWVDDQTMQMVIPGRLGSSSYQFDENQLDPESKNQVLRYSHDFGNQNRAGFSYTHRNAQDYDNKVSSFDGKYWLDEDNSIAIQYISTETENPQPLVDAFSDTRDYFIAPNMSGDATIFEYRMNNRNWWAFADYVSFDKGFRADLGFFKRSDFKKFAIGGGHRWYPSDNDSWWSRMSLGSDYDITEDQSGNPLEEEFEFNFDLAGALQSNFRVGAGLRDRLWYIQENEQLTPTMFRENFQYARASFRPIGNLRLFVFIESSDRVDFDNYRIGKQLRLSPEIEWQLNRHWLAKLAHNRVNFDAANAKLFTAEVTNFRLTYQFNIRSFVRLTIQDVHISRNQANYLDDDNNPLTPVVNAHDNSQSLQLLYSYKVNPRTLIFAGYSDAGYQDDSLTSLAKTDKQLFMKFSYAWQL